jgi:hypothetical protein
VTAGRVRLGELMAGAGAAVLFVVLFLDWFEQSLRVRTVETSGRVVGPELNLSGWSALGWWMDVLLLVVIVLAGWLVLSTIAAATVSQPVAAGVIGSAVGLFALGVLILRVAVFQPDLGVGLPDELVAVKWPAYVGIAAMAVLVAGSWLSMGDERTDAPESAYEPPPPRQAPSRRRR